MRSTPTTPRYPLLSAAFAAAAVLLAACGDDGPAEAVDAFAEDPDCFGIELADLNPDEVRCGTVTAPLHHDDPEGPTISLAVATLTEDDPDGEPILVLGGGPGEVVVETVLTEPNARQLFAFEGREVILLDQRGVGSSDPELTCDAFDRLDLTAAPDQQEQRDALLACRQELVERDVDLDAFDHGNNARDVDLVRRALGHDQVVLRGGSYGSHLALHAAALAPDAFSALVLSSPADPTGNYLEAGPGGFQAALDRIDDACSQDERCTDQLGDVHEAITEVADRLAAEPQEVTAAPLTGGEAVTRTFTAEAFLGAVFATFYLPDGAFALPVLLAAALDGDLEPLAGLAATIDSGLEDIPRGMYLSMVCSGEGASYDAEVARAGLRSPVLADRWFDQAGLGGQGTAELCALWDVEATLQPGELELASDLPTLLFTGEVDHVTPPGLGQQLHAQLPASHLVEVRGLAHAPLEGLDALAGGCGSEIVAAFLDDPNRTPNTICTRQIPPLDALGQFLP
jgi:pimeloyl-ACP methyl ester carboxylesterase